MTTHVASETLLAVGSLDSLLARLLLVLRGLEVEMSSLIKFFIASMFMWVAPVAILYGCNHDLLPGSTNLSSYSMTLLSGFLAVISVNVVIALYICMAMRETLDKHEPDPAFLASAKTSLNQKPNEADDSSQTCEKED